MSFRKAIWWRPASALAVLALAVLALSVMGNGTAFAGGTDGSVAVNPNPKEIGVGGTGDVTVDLTPASAGTSIWIIEVAYDPTVAQVATDGSGNPICTVPNDDPSAADAYGCDTKDTNNDQVDDTAVAFGGYVVNNNGTAEGLTTEKTVATFTFKAVGAEGTSTPLTTTVNSFLGPNGETPTAATTNGAINITGSTGTERIWGDVNCDTHFSGGDAINVDRFLVGLGRTGNPPADCPALDATVNVNGGSFMYGDVNCSGAVTGGDAVNIDRALVGLPVTPTPPANCPTMGTSYTIS